MTMVSCVLSRLSAAITLTAALAFTGCAAPAAGTVPGGSPPSTTAMLSGELTIYAAASLKPGFDELATAFGAAHPGVTVAPVVYDGSSRLAIQIIEGAGVDVFAAADESTMQRVVDAGLAAAPKVFAANTLTLVVPRGNRAGVSGLADLAQPDLTVALCAIEVPCGAATSTLFAATGVTPDVDSYEQNVAAVLAKVSTGEVDAGLVYVTDAARSAEVEVIEVAGADAVVNRYPIAALTGSAHPRVADAFVRYVQSAEASAVLAGLGFGAP